MLYAERHCGTCGQFFSGPVPEIQTAYNAHVRSCRARKTAAVPSKPITPPPPARPKLASAHVAELRALCPENVPSGFVDTLVKQRPSILFNDACLEILRASNQADQATRIGQAVDRLRSGQALQPLTH